MKILVSSDINTVKLTRNIYNDISNSVKSMEIFFNDNHVGSSFLTIRDRAKDDNFDYLIWHHSAQKINAISILNLRNPFGVSDVIDVDDVKNYIDYEQMI